MPEEYFLTLVGPRVGPAARPWESGLPLEGGHTLPFVVERGWVGPAGTYIEQWSIRDGDRVLYRHPAKYIEVRGFQSVRRFSDTVQAPLTLEPGVYDVIFVVEEYRMGSLTIEVGPLGDREAPQAAPPAPSAAAAPPPPAAPAPAKPAPAPAPAPAAAAPPAAAAAAYTGEDPAAARKRVYEEELAKGSDPRIAEGRSKSAEIKAKRAMAAAAAAAPAPPPAPAPVAPPQDPEAPPAPAAAPPPAAPPPAPPPSAAPPAASAPTSPLRPDAPPEGGGMGADEAAAVRAIVFQQAIDAGSTPEVAEAQAKAAEIRAERGPWWHPDW